MNNEVQSIVIDPNWIMAIIAFCAIVSPIITAIINNIHQSKIKQLETYELAKRQALKDYISALYKASVFSSSDVTANYFICLNNLYLYFDDLDKLNHDELIIVNKDIAYQDHVSHKTIELLSKQIKKK